MRLKCKKCLKFKSSKFFHNCKSKPSGKQNCCKKCNNLNLKTWKQNNPERIKEAKLLYLKENKEIIIQKSKLYREKNKEILSKNQSKRKESKKLKESKKIFRYLVRYVTYSAFRRLKETKIVRTEFALGCNIDNARIYIESKFYDGMTWENHGSGEGSWQMDHIMPLGLAKSVDDIIKLSHYTNLQPLWYKDHLIKTKKDRKLIKLNKINSLQNTIPDLTQSLISK